MVTSAPLGRLIHYKPFSSALITPRPVDVWLPPDYSPKNRYPVLYMHDGQNLFESATAYGGIDWGVIDAALRLMATDEIAPLIIVGIWNTPERRREYMPAAPLQRPENAPLLAQFSQEFGGPPTSDAYLRFIIEELKPFIDQTYATHPEQRHTAIMGSSMGGLISLYALLRYPQVFGGAGCVSTHWTIGKEALVDAMAALLPPPGNHRLYFDFGTETLDADYEPYQQRMDAHLLQAGYVQNQDCLTLKFEGAEHSERAWRARVHLPLRFLFGKR
mgnify:CR=1 FL=1